MKHLLLAGALLLAVAAPSQAFSDKDEAAMGRRMAESLESSMGGVLPMSHPVALRVHRIGKKFEALAPKRLFPIRYRVLNNPHILNAFAAPGGTIYITTRLVKFARSEDELASIIGHETAHVSQRHIAQEIDEHNAFVRWGRRIGHEMRRAAQEDAAARSKNKKAKIAKAPNSTPTSAPANSDDGMDRGSPGASSAWFLLSRGRSRAMETEADTLSVRWMRRLGYNPRAAISLLLHADKAMGGSPSGLGSLLSSHPGIPQRVEDIREMIVREKLDKPNATAKSAPAVPAKAKPAAAATPATPGAAKAPTTAASDVAAGATPAAP